MQLAFGTLAIELTDEETILASQIDFNPGSHNAYSWQPIADAMEALMNSLMEREAIPLARRKFFTDPAYFIGGRGRSRRQVFEGNGRSGVDIFRHGNFVKYLRYFRLRTRSAAAGHRRISAQSHCLRK